MKLEELGYNQQLENYRKENKLEGFVPGRVISEHRERYIVRTEDGDREAEITGNMRFTASGREDFPAVGDWVALMNFEGGNAIIHHIFPRSSTIKRQAVGQSGEVQLIATNIDYAFLVQAVDRDFNINRLERYLAISHSSGVSPVILLTKTDLIEPGKLDGIRSEIRKRIPGTPVIAVSNETGEGYDELKALIGKGQTCCMLGSSGVGKSTLANHLSGRSHMKTGHISDSTGKGRHVTSHRELVLLEGGGILIDNPGMREVGLADAGDGLENTFDQISILAQDCRFKDCTHTSETGCAVTAAVEDGEIDPKAYENFLKLHREQAHYESTVAEKRQKEKDFGKMMKNYKRLWKE